ncbi:MAG: phenylacetate--CoA ligase family protein [Thermovirgaceae bacterium]
MRKRKERQLENLQKTVRRMWEGVPFYRARMEDRNLSPEDIKSLEDLRQLPFMTKEDLRDQYPMGILACGRRDVRRVHASSGTTGKPTVVSYTQGDLDSWSECMARCLERAGMTADDVFQVILGYGLFTGALGFHYGAERLGAMVVPTGGGFTGRQIMLMEDLATTVFTSTPSYALYLAEEIEKRGIRDRLNLRLAILGGEAWTAQMRDRIEEALGVTALDSYGLSEVIGPGVAMECPEKTGLHANWDHFLFEIVDPETGLSVEEGQRGELVITSLTKEAMPVIRYRTRDLTRFLSGPCPCGRDDLRIDRVKGRCDDMMIIRGVNVFPSQIEAVLGQFPEVSLHYFLEVTEKKGLKEMTVVCEDENFLDREEKERLRQRVGKALHEVLGIRVGLRLVDPGTVERSSGKAVRIVRVQVGGER